MKPISRVEHSWRTARPLWAWLALSMTSSLAAAAPALPSFRGLQRDADGRVTLNIIPAGATGEFIDVYSTDSLTSSVWQLRGAYLRPSGKQDLLWSEPAGAVTQEQARARFFRVGRADIDADENGIPDSREALTHIHDLTPDARARWARAGLGGSPTNYTTVLNVRNYGAKGNGTTDDAAAINAVISQAAAGSVVYVPAGTYRLTQPLYLKSDMILRGDGAALTSLIFEGAGTVDRCIGLICWESSQPTTYATLTDGLAAGSTVLTVSSVSGYAAGAIIEIEEDNDPTWGLNDTWQLRLPGQLNRVMAVDTVNRKLTVDRPLRHTFTPSRNPRLRRLVTVSNTGIEKLFIRRKDAIVGYTIEMKYAARCWVSKVESYMTYKAHVWMERGYECEIRQSYFHDAFVFGGDGQGYGVACGKHTCDCLVEDNLFQHLRHSMSVGIGANGNVYGYNFSTQRALDPVLGTPQADISVHGNFVFMNLFEGNVLEDADVPDWYWPAGPGNTLFRNRVLNSGTAIDVGSNNQNLLGNVLTQGTITTAKSLSGIVDYGNVKQGDTAGVTWPGCTCHTLPDSLYRCVPPDFILGAAAAGVTWPPIGPEKPINSVTPAQQRYGSGAYVP